MSEQETRQPTRIEVYAVVTRADGTVHDQGLIAARYSWRKPVRKLTWPLRKALAGRRIRRANQHATTGRDA